MDVYFAPEAGADSGVANNLLTHLEKLRPVGADVKVIQATPVTVNVAAAVTPSGETPLSTIKAAMETALSDYLSQLGLNENGQTVSINRIIGLLMNCEGVADAGSVTLNGAASNLVLGRGSYAVSGTVELTEVDNG